MEIDITNDLGLREAQTQELWLILNNSRLKNKIAALRKSHRISPSLTKKLWAAHTKFAAKIKRQKRAHRRASTRLIQAWENAGEQWHLYWNRIPEEELKQLRLAAGLPGTWDSFLKCHLYGTRELPGDWKLLPPPFLALPVVSLQNDGSPGKKGELRLFIELFKSTGIEEIRRVWPIVMEHQKRLPGRGRFRLKKQLGRDKRIVFRRRRGELGITLLDAICQTQAEGNTSVQPDAFRQANHRLLKRLR